MRMFLGPLLVKSNRNVKGRFFVLALQAENVAAHARPGQFLHVRVGSGSFPLLRRAFSIYRVVGDDEVLILYETIGDGTRLLSRTQDGECIDSHGPFGRPFSRPTGKRVVVVGGGIGIAPLLFLAEYLRAQGHELEVVLGFRSQDDMIGAEDFRQLGFQPIITTDDGSYGIPGYVDHALKELLRPESHVFACGPIAMLQAVARLCVPRDIPCEVSIHSIMGCGFGICLGCAFETRQGYTLTCTDGPVIDARDILV